MTGLCWAVRLSEKAMEPGFQRKRRAWKGHAEKTALAAGMLRLAKEAEGQGPKQLSCSPIRSEQAGRPSPFRSQVWLAFTTYEQGNRPCVNQC